MTLSDVCASCPAGLVCLVGAERSAFRCRKCFRFFVWLGPKSFSFSFSFSYNHFYGAEIVVPGSIAVHCPLMPDGTDIISCDACRMREEIMQKLKKEFPPGTRDSLTRSSHDP